MSSSSLNNSNSTPDYFAIFYPLDSSKSNKIFQCNSCCSSGCGKISVKGIRSPWSLFGVPPVDYFNSLIDLQQIPKAYTAWFDLTQTKNKIDTALNEFENYGWNKEKLIEMINSKFESKPYQIYKTCQGFSNYYNCFNKIIDGDGKLDSLNNLEYYQGVIYLYPSKQTNKQVISKFNTDQIPELLNAESELGVYKQRLEFLTSMLEFAKQCFPYEKLISDIKNITEDINELKNNINYEVTYNDHLEKRSVKRKRGTDI